MFSGSKGINHQPGHQVGEKISFGIRILSSLTVCAILLVRGTVMVMRVRDISQHTSRHMRIPACHSPTAVYYSFRSDHDRLLWQRYDNHDRTVRQLNQDGPQ